MKHFGLAPGQVVTITFIAAVDLLSASEQLEYESLRQIVRNFRNVNERLDDTFTVWAINRQRELESKHDEIARNKKGWAWLGSER